MKFNRMIMEKESPEELGYEKIKYNLTESSVPDLRLSDVMDIENIRNVLLSYGDHKGFLPLRKKIAENYPNLNESNIIVTNGACLSLFLINATFLSSNDRILVMGPNYAANYEVPRSLDAKIDYLEMNYKNRFNISFEDVKSKFSDDTKLISITCPHNPTGTLLQEEEYIKIIEFAESKKCYILVDETYRELTFEKKLPVAASLSKYAISVESLSKAFGIPGIRIGWLVSQDLELLERLLSAKEQICICNSILDEVVAFEVLKEKSKILEPISKENQQKFAFMKDWIEREKRLEWIEPKGGVISFPRIKEEYNLDISEFYKELNSLGTYVGPGHWFEMPDRHFRLGYGWMDIESLKMALNTISMTLDKTIKN